MKSLTLLITFFCSAFVHARVNVVLVGATGNLAKKYLFQAFHDQIQMNDDIYLTPAARKPSDRGQPIIDLTMTGNVTCVKDPAFGSCSEQSAKFQKHVLPYQKLKTDEDYIALASELRDGLDASGETETGRLIYLSIPPKAFGFHAKNINQHMRPAEGAWLRVVVEKPFGKDVASAQVLADTLIEHLADEEILRVDHYLGKAGVSAITKFRSLNPTHDSVLNKHNVQRVEVAMHETEDCAGRTGFFDEYGTIRDVLQNHVTEMAVLAAMDVVDQNGPESQATLELFAKSKRAALKSMTAPKERQTLIGQYDGYADHVEADLRSWKSDEDMANWEGTNTPTYATSIAYFNNERWEGIPFFLTGGKKLPVRKAFVRYVLRNGEVVNVQVQGPGGTFVESTLDEGSVNMHSLEGWEHSMMEGGQKISLASQKNAYWVVVDRALARDATLFVDTENLMTSWRVWTPLLHSVEDKKPITYSDTSKVGSKQLADYEFLSEMLLHEHNEL